MVAGVDVSFGLYCRLMFPGSDFLFDAFVDGR